MHHRQIFRKLKAGSCRPQELQFAMFSVTQSFNVKLQFASSHI